MMWMLMLLMAVIIFLWCYTFIHWIVTIGLWCARIYNYFSTMSGQKRRSIWSVIFSVLQLILCILLLVCCPYFWSFLVFNMCIKPNNCISLFIPVPQQKHSFDCGLFVCWYALAIFKIREIIIFTSVMSGTTTPLTLLIMNNEYF